MTPNREDLDEFERVVVNGFREHVKPSNAIRAEPGSRTCFSKKRGTELLSRIGDLSYLTVLLGEKREEEEEEMGDRAITLEELEQQHHPQSEPIIEGLLNEQETIVIAGRQKVGKSRLVQQMALCVACGEAFLRMRIPKPGNVLVIDFENRPGPLDARFKRMGAADSAKRRVFVWCARSLHSILPDSTEQGVAFLLRLVVQARPVLLIIDTWRLCLAGGDENDAREVVRALKALSTLRTVLPNLAIVIVHHIRKEKSESPRRLLQDPSLWTDAVSGHHALPSHVDACYGLERQAGDDGEEMIVFGGIARNNEPRTVILDEDQDTLRFEVPTNESAALKVMTKAQTDIWNILRHRPKFRFNEALTAAATTNRKALSATLKIAEIHGCVVRDGGFYVVCAGE
jgi:hypothetical protein